MTKSNISPMIIGNCKMKLTEISDTLNISTIISIFVHFVQNLNLCSATNGRNDGQ